MTNACQQARVNRSLAISGNFSKDVEFVIAADGFMVMAHGERGLHQTAIGGRSGLEGVSQTKRDCFDSAIAR